MSPRLVDRWTAPRGCAPRRCRSRAPRWCARSGPFALAGLLDEVGRSLLAQDQTSIRWRNEVRAEVMLHADRDQLFRVLVNLGRNAVQALGEAGG